MSIFTHLAQQSAEDIRLLNCAMALLNVVRSNPTTEAYMKQRIDELEASVVAHQRNDHRFRSSTVAFDMNEYPVQKPAGKPKKAVIPARIGTKASALDYGPHEMGYNTAINDCAAKLRAQGIVVEEEK